jgi:hypothetical protein
MIRSNVSGNDRRRLAEAANFQQTLPTPPALPVVSIELSPWLICKPSLKGEDGLCAMLSPPVFVFAEMPPPFAERFGYTHDKQVERSRQAPIFVMTNHAWAFIRDDESKWL